MSALEHSGPEGDLQRDPELIDDRPSSLDYRNVHDKLQPQQPGKDAFDETSTVNGRRLEVESVTASTLGAFVAIEGRNALITAAGLRNIVSMMELNKEARGAHGLPNDQSGIPTEALARFGGFLTLQAANHPSPGAESAIREVVNRYFTPAQA